MFFLKKIIKKLESFYRATSYKLDMLYFENIKPIFRPQHSRIRKVIPRTWADITSLIVDVNFEFVKSFYEEEYKAGIVDWNSDKNHKEFAKWLESAYKYITITRPRLEKDLENAYPSVTKDFLEMFKEEVDKEGRRTYRLVDDGIPYKVKYKDVIRIEKNIEKKDTQFLTGLIEKRAYFWT
jgi:hypothetical protein